MADEREFIIECIVKDVKASFSSCLNCQHFNEQREECLLYKARPPARVIAFACPEFTHVVIPF